ncbi:mannitol-specific phosphotransferase system IIBC component [Arthrobacter sp. JUb119]|nr:mannitol-specific phosphotransferase system IIBC component [Arthrobacter sp. JUb119]
MKWPIFVSGIIGLVVAFAVAYLFFNKLRLKANEDIRNAFSKTSANKTRMQLADEAVEDEFDESQRKQTPGAE